jgi:hypothetical protein
MKTKKGTYKIAKDAGWSVEEGSVGYDYPFMVHKKKGGLWTITHMATGHRVVHNISTLKEAKRRVGLLKPYTVFLMPDLETWQMARSRMQNNKPEEYRKLLRILAGEIK